MPLIHDVKGIVTDKIGPKAPNEQTAGHDTESESENSPGEEPFRE